MSEKDDLESGSELPLLHSALEENLELRWSFIRKVYTIISIQLLLIIAVGYVVVTVHPISHFFATTIVGLVLQILISITPLIIMCALAIYSQRHFINYILFVIFILSLAIAVGLTCSYTSGKVVLEAVMLTAVVMVSLTLYTFWAAKRGHDFSFLRPFLFGAIIVLIVAGIIQISFPLGKISTMIYGCLGALIFSAYIIFDTNYNLIKRYTYDQYIWAYVTLYVDIIDMFLYLLAAIFLRLATDS